MRVEVIDFELNGGCNLKCPMCPQATGREKDFLKKLPFDTYIKVLEDGITHGLKTVTLHGSGEPTLVKNMPLYVYAAKERGLKVISFTNGKKLTNKLSDELIDAGIDILRLSAIGYNEETYGKWMKGGDYQLARDNFRYFVEASQGTSSEGHINHLIIDKDNIEYEVAQYLINWGVYTGAKQEIWLMHGWAGNENVELMYKRKGERRTCGRPHAPLLQVRAGGVDGHNATVTSCCMTLGNDSISALGTLDTQTIEEVVNGEKYAELKKAHEEGRFDDIPYCANCDQLYDTPEALVWTNIEGREYNQSKSLSSLRFEV